MTWSFVLKTSRPGLWFPTIWLYLLPLSGSELWRSNAFWIGLIFITFPLNLLVYGWNDLVDTETDRLNPRKDSYLFGACGTDGELRRLPLTIAAVQALCWPAMIYVGGWQTAAALIGVLIFCWIYNHPGWGWRSKPPLELFCQVGYLLVLPITVSLNGVPFPSLWVMVYLSLFCLQSQLIGEVMDIEPDSTAGRRTTATAIGAIWTKTLIIAVVIAEILMLGLCFGDWPFAGGLGLFLCWLLFDLVKIGAKKYSTVQFRLFGIGSNGAAALSMIYIWKSGVFG